MTQRLTPRYMHVSGAAVELKADEAERARLFAAAERVVTGMKQETAKAM